MDDLRQRFGALDSVSVPDLWPDIERRASKWSGATARPTAVLQKPQRQIGLTVALALIVGALLFGAVAAMGVGQFLNQLAPAPSRVSPSPAGATSSPTPAGTYDCSAAQVMGQIHANNWSARFGQPGVSSAAPRAGWIAAWGSDEVPQLVLVNPLTGQTCPTLTFDYARTPTLSPLPSFFSQDQVPLRGALAWTPDGFALAFVVVAPDKDALYVVSPSGVVGPIAQTRDAGQHLGRPSWSPDGSQVAVPGFRIVVPPDFGSPRGSGPSVWIAHDDGTVKELTLDCGSCEVSPVSWSPSGSRFALQAGGDIYLGDSSESSLTKLRASGSDGTLTGWSDETTLRLFDSSGHLIDVPIATPTATVDLGPTGLTPALGFLVASPDDKRIVQRQKTGSDRADLVITDLATATSSTVVRDISAFGGVFWSPDGATIGYVVEERGPDQGLWLVSTDGKNLRHLTGEPLLENGSQTSVWQPRY